MYGNHSSLRYILLLQEGSVTSFDSFTHIAALRLIRRNGRHKLGHAQNI